MTSHSLALYRSRLLRLGWPFGASLASLAVSIGLIAFGINTARVTLRVNQDIQSLETKIQTFGNLGATAKLAPSEYANPAPSQYTKDLGLLFKTAKVHGIPFGTVNYKTERTDLINIAVYTLEVHLTGDYPTFKRFIADVLQALPNCVLQEVRIERQDPATPLSSTAVKFALLYQLDTEAAR